MLPQELHPDVHQLHRIQGAAAVVGVARRVGGLPGEFVQHLDAGIVCSGFDLVDIARVPAQGRVQLFPQTVSGHEGLSGAALFSGAAEKDHGSRSSAFLQPGLDGAGRRERADPQQVVTAAVAVSARRHRGRFRCAGLLAEAGERVKLAQDSDHGPAASEAAAEGRGNIAEILRHREAQLPKLSAVELRRPEFLQGQFRVFPDFIRHCAEEAGMLFDHGEGPNFVLPHHSTLDRKSCRRGFCG